MAVSTFIGSMLNKINKNPDHSGIIYSIPRPGGRAITKNIGFQIRDLLLQARRYHLGSDFTKLASTYCFNIDDPVKKLLTIAKAPFESVWLEWPVKDQLISLDIEPEPDAPDFTGVLVRKLKGYTSRYLITTITTSDVTPSVEIYPVSIVFDTEKPIDEGEFDKDLSVIHECVEDFITFKNVDGSTKKATTEAELNLVLKTTLMGGRVEDIRPDGTYHVYSGNADHRKILTQHTSYCLTPDYGAKFARILNDDSVNQGAKDALRYVVMEYIKETSGMFRFVLSSLAILNSKEYSRRQPIKPGERRPGEATKPHPQPSYEFVTIAAPHTVILRDIQGDDHEHQHNMRRRHEVSGTWVNYHKTGKEDCDHAFANLDDTGDRKICILCGRRRSWRRDHERGNAELGFKPRSPRIVLAK